ncbi:hypothetical protein [Bartonella henselae]|nr:hypothetical protein [Bartonella henselae]MDM9983298.1 hypothetical protein [Bartonella henselae]MDM9985468.1 hypothetical protein [Bartonella henselae]MDM9986960.1 hypothetical protein [Bartonella henselae]MDM9988429.1 hypothetical protein [Bartonella henselae]MDM9991094.1 hypothetical protein [Bartonella henselae]
MCLRYINRLAVFVSLSSDDDPKPSGDLDKTSPPWALKNAFLDKI